MSDPKKMTIRELEEELDRQGKDKLEKTALAAADLQAFLDHPHGLALTGDAAKLGPRIGDLAKNDGLKAVYLRVHRLSTDGLDPDKCLSAAKAQLVKTPGLDEEAMVRIIGPGGTNEAFAESVVRSVYPAAKAWHDGELAKAATPVYEPIGDSERKLIEQLKVGRAGVDAAQRALPKHDPVAVAAIYNGAAVVRGWFWRHKGFVALIVILIVGGIWAFSSGLIGKASDTVAGMTEEDKEAAEERKAEKAERDVREAEYSSLYENFRALLREVENLDETLGKRLGANESLLDRFVRFSTGRDPVTGRSVESVNMLGANAAFDRADKAWQSKATWRTAKADLEDTLARVKAEWKAIRDAASAVGPGGTTLEAALEARRKAIAEEREAAAVAAREAAEAKARAEAEARAAAIAEADQVGKEFEAQKAEILNLLGRAVNPLDATGEVNSGYQPKCDLALTIFRGTPMNESILVWLASRYANAKIVLDDASAPEKDKVKATREMSALRRYVLLEIINSTDNTRAGWRPANNEDLDKWLGTLSRYIEPLRQWMADWKDLVPASAAHGAAERNRRYPAKPILE